MANCQNNMRCMRRTGSSAAPSDSAFRSQTGQAPGCPDTHDHFPPDMPIAMAYVPWQQWRDLYEPCKALERGTLFMELDKPFLGKGGRTR